MRSAFPIPANTRVIYGTKPPVINFEAIVEAANAAVAAQQAANNSFLLALFILAAIMILTVATAWIGYHVYELHKLAESMKGTLGKTIRDLALLEGEADWPS